MTAHAQSRGEFIALMAFLMSIVALSIDAILPAFHAIGDSYQVSDENQLQLMIGTVLLGMALGQLLFGPLSDSIGRKNGIYWGLGLFIIGSFLSIFATSYDMHLVGRFLQGFGAAAPRTITIAIVRDQFSGREMARIMSFVITIFILVPAMAPSMGAGLLIVGTWEMIFYSFIALSLFNLCWMKFRQPETLHPDFRRPFKLSVILNGAREALSHPVSFGYMIIAGLGFAFLVSYLNTSKQIFLDLFGIDELFPIYFGSLALVIGLSSIVNGKIVRKLGMQLIMKTALSALVVISAVFFIYLNVTEGHPPLVFFMVMMAIMFFFMGLMFGNSNALAMEPLGHIAGIASSVIGAGTSLVSLTIGGIIGQLYDHTLMPIVSGFLVLSILALGLMYMVEKKRSV
jgi:DHA1 family bicyclomycin/chloramphenicol resistance-like MFS transporter